MVDYIVEHGMRALIFWIVGLAMVGIGFFAYGLYPSAHIPTVPSDRWQAVFLSNNQVYFGKLQDYNAAYVALSDVYYLRSSSDLDNPNVQSNLNLIKLGGELHGPDDEIFVPKASILYWENMKNTSRVVQSIINAKQ